MAWNNWKRFFPHLAAGLEVIGLRKTLVGWNLPEGYIVCTAYELSSNGQAVTPAELRRINEEMVCTFDDLWKRFQASPGYGAFPVEIPATHVKCAACDNTSRVTICEVPLRAYAHIAEDLERHGKSHTVYRHSPEEGGGHTFFIFPDTYLSYLDFQAQNPQIRKETHPMPNKKV